MPIKIHELIVKLNLTDQKKVHEMPISDVEDSSLSANYYNVKDDLLEMAKKSFNDIQER